MVLYERNKKQKHLSNLSPSGRKVAEACPWNGGGGWSEGGREETKNNCVNEI